MNNTFDNIILTGRPASGKSELIDFLKSVSVNERAEKYHIGEFKELDDFLWIWDLGENDDIWEKMGRKRVFTKNVGCGYIPSDEFTSELLYDDFLSKKLNRELMVNYMNEPEFYKNHTLFVEFARGGEKGCQTTLNYFDEKILKSSAIFFLNNSFEECVRRNNARYEEKKKFSILAHKLPDPEMNGYYRTNDWARLSGGKSDGYVAIKGVKVPFVTVANEPELTDPKLIEQRFSAPLKKLWDLYNNR